MKKTILVIFYFVYFCAFPKEGNADSLYARMKEGNDLFDKGKFEEALNTFVDAQIEYPEDSNLKYNIASAHYKMNHYEEAVKGYLDVASNARDIKLEEKSLYNIGNAMYRQGKLEEAVDYYKKAIALEPEDKDAKQNLEFVLEEIKRRINEAKKTQEEQNQKQQEKQNQQEDNKTSEKEQTCQNGQKQEQGENQQGQQQQQEQQQGQQGQEQKQKQEQKQEQKQGNEQKEEGDQNSQDKNKSSKDEPEQGGVKKEQEQAVTGEKSKEKGGDNATAYAKQMTKEEAEQWLNSAQESRDKFKKKNQAMKGTLPYSSDKDW